MNQHLQEMRRGERSVNDLQQTKTNLDASEGRIKILKFSLAEAHKRLDCISNNTRSMLVRALADLRSTLYKNLRQLQREYGRTRLERTKIKRDETELQLQDTTASLGDERAM